MKIDANNFADPSCFEGAKFLGGDVLRLPSDMPELTGGPMEIHFPAQTTTGGATELKHLIIAWLRHLKTSDFEGIRTRRGDYMVAPTKGGPIVQSVEDAVSILRNWAGGKYTYLDGGWGDTPLRLRLYRRPGVPGSRLARWIAHYQETGHYPTPDF